MTKKPQRIQLDNAIPDDDMLDYKDVLIYATLLTRADKDLYTCYISMDTLAEKCELSKDTIKKRLEKLEQNGNLKIAKQGRKNIYTLNRPPKYLKDKEEFTMSFMNDSNLSAKEKGLLLCLQYKMNNKESGIGELKNFSLNKISKIMKCGKNTCTNILNSLKDKEVLINTLNTNSSLSDFKFDLNKIGQAVLFIAEQVDNNTKEIYYLNKKMERMENEYESKIKSLEHEIYKMKCGEIVH